MAFPQVLIVASLHVPPHTSNPSAVVWILRQEEGCLWMRVHRPLQTPRKDRPKGVSQFFCGPRVCGWMCAAPRWLWFGDQVGFLWLPVKFLCKQHLPGLGEGSRSGWFLWTTAFAFSEQWLQQGHLDYLQALIVARLGLACIFFAFGAERVRFALSWRLLSDPERVEKCFRE